MLYPQSSKDIGWNQEEDGDGGTPEPLRCPFCNEDVYHPDPTDKDGIGWVICGRCGHLYLKEHGRIAYQKDTGVEPEEAPTRDGEPPCCECGGNHHCDDCPIFTRQPVTGAAAIQAANAQLSHGVALPTVQIDSGDGDGPVPWTIDANLKEVRPNARPWDGIPVNPQTLNALLGASKLHVIVNEKDGQFVILPRALEDLIEDLKEK